MLEADEFLLRASLGRVRLRVRSSPQEVGAGEQALMRHAAFALRVAVEQRDAEAITLTLRLEHALSSSGGFSLQVTGARRLSDGALDVLVARVVAAMQSGRISVARDAVNPLSERRFEELPNLPPLPPAAREKDDTFFELRLVDEIGRAIDGVAVEFQLAGESRDVTTNAAGVALLENASVSTARAVVADAERLDSILDARWGKRRAGKPLKEANTTELEFGGAALGPLPVKAAVPNTLVLVPPKGRLFAELFDKTGRVRHGNRPYTIQGPEPLSGETDALGRLLHDAVFRGDYTLKFSIEALDGKDQQTDSLATQLVVLAPACSEPEVRLLGAVPLCVLARLHCFFNTNKAFLLPTALTGMRALRKLYRENEPCKLLVVGHADTAAGPAINDLLSLERAEATVAYLKDDVEAWLAFYAESVPKNKRWGAPEDRMMLRAMQGFAQKPRGEDVISWFQATRKLEPVDGKAGPDTRRKLISEYMQLDGVSLGNFAGVEAIAHGCGENFPLDDAGDDLEPAPQDSKRDPGDRRVELFFFDAEFGIVPTPPGNNSKAGSTEYPTWRRRAVQTVDLEASELDGPELVFIELFDGLFRTNSAVVLPEGETPTQSAAGHQALTAIGAFATILRFNDEQRGRKLLVAGHCDTTATVEFNQKLSEERAECALAVLTGGRASFQALCDARHTVADIKQILSWVSRALPDFFSDCDPGVIDGDAPSGVEPVRRFQRAYNASKAELGASAADLKPDGVVGTLTWGAFFDCYELALEQELGEDAAGVAALRQSLVFVDDQRKALGFSEHFPIEELGVDHFESQSNRRVELLLFEAGEEPDTEHAEADPETSEIYLPSVYRRRPVRASSAREGVFVSQDLVVPMELDPDRDPATETSLELTGDNGFVRRLAPTDAEVGARADGAALLFRFSDLPKGAYRLFSVTEAARHCILRGLAVSKLGVFVGGQALPSQVPPPSSDEEGVLEPAVEPDRSVNEEPFC